MLKSCLKSFAAETAQNVTLRAAGRGVAGSINFGLLVAGQNHVRAMLKAAGEASGVDGYNNLMSQDDADQQEVRQQVDHGGYVKMPEAERCGYLRCLRDIIADDLLKHAEMVDGVGPLAGKEFPNPYHIIDPLSFTFTRNVNRTPGEITAEQKLTARALGVTPEEMYASDLQMAKTNAAFLAKNKVEILEHANSFHFDNPEGWTADVILDKLHPLDQLRLMIAADNGLFFVRKTEAMRYVRNSTLKDCLTHVGLLDGERKELHTRINAFCVVPAHKQAIRQARERGETIPVMKALVTPLADDKKQATA